MSIEAVVSRVDEHGCSLVELTGGEPLLQRDAPALMEALLGRGYEVLLETSGSRPIDQVPHGVRRIVDVKCPASGEADRNRWENLDLLAPGDELKFVITDRADYDWAVRLLSERTIPQRVPIHFSPVHGELDPETLAGWVLGDRLRVRVQLQLHKLLWPEVVRGV